MVIGSRTASACCSCGLAHGAAWNHVPMRVWMHVHVRVRMHMHVRVHVHVRMDMHVRMGVHVRVHVHVCMHMRVAANVHVRAMSRSLCLGQTDGHGNRKQRNSKSLQHDVSSRVAFAAKLDFTPYSGSNEPSMNNGIAAAA
jgi:hypothetical protein